MGLILVRCCFVKFGEVNNGILGGRKLYGDRMKEFYWYAGVLMLSGILACSTAQTKITSYDECVAAGNVILRSMPPQCVTRDGKRFVGQSPKPLVTPEAKVEACKDSCGDGECQEVVCLALGCPCAETRESCPQDCK